MLRRPQQIVARRAAISSLTKSSWYPAAAALHSMRFCSGDAGRYAESVANAPGSAAPRSSGAPAGGSEDYAYVTKNHVWGLWNEGNLFSLSIPELTAFLQNQGIEVASGSKKSALVRQVEEVMAAEQPNMVNPETDVAPAHADDEYASKGSDLLEEQDVYGDWGADGGSEDRKGLDFMEVSRDALVDSQKAKKAYLGPRAFQLLQGDITADVGLGAFDPSKLPGCANRRTALTPIAIKPEDANKIRFRRAFQWCSTNLWNMNLGGEINVGAGKALYWRAVAKHNKNVLPLWTCQGHLRSSHPYTWFAVAHDSNTADMERMAAHMGMTLTQEPETSYKVLVRRPRGDVLDVELNAQLQTTLVNKPWDRLLCTHLLRSKMPDLRYLVRARVPIRQRYTDAFYETEMLRMTQDSVQSLLAPDLGTIEYTCERVMRKWSMELQCGGQVSLVETRRTPLIITRSGDEGERLEYELIASMPRQDDNIDVAAMSDEVYDKGMEFARVLEEGMAELHAHTMPSAAAFDLA